MPPWHADAPHGTFRNERGLTSGAEGPDRAMGGRGCAGRQSCRSACRRRRSPPAGASASRMRSSRCRRTTPFPPRARSSTSTSTSRRTSPRRSGCRRSRRGRVIGCSSTTCSSTTRRRPTVRARRPCCSPIAKTVECQRDDRRRKPAAARRELRGPPAGDLCARHQPAGVSVGYRASSATWWRAAFADPLHREWHRRHRSDEGRDDLREGAARAGDARRAVPQRPVHDPGRRLQSRSEHRRRVSRRTPRCGDSSRTPTFAGSGGATRSNCPTARRSRSCRCRDTTSTGRPTTCSRSRCDSQGRPHSIDRVVRQLLRESIESRSDDRREVGRSDVGRDAVHGHHVLGEAAVM